MELDKITRTIGSSGLSIGTHLMYESVFPNLKRYDDTRMPPDEVSLKDYNVHYFNLYTLVRNIINSYQELNKDKIMNNKKLIEVILNEIYLLEEMYNNETKLIFYLCKYDRAIKSYNNKKNLNHYGRYERYVVFTNFLRSIVSKNKELKEKVVESDFKLPKTPPNLKVLITSHFALDLRNKMDLELLESHTGRLKKPIEFNSKYHGLGEMDLSSIPFIPELLYILGDETLVKICDTGTRREVINKGMEKNWTPLTSRYKVLTDIKDIQGARKAIFNFSDVY